jgi:hypothetical protein
MAEMSTSALSVLEKENEFWVNGCTYIYIKDIRTDSTLGTQFQSLGQTIQDTTQHHIFQTLQCLFFIIQGI